jgi:putative spermidine/putrescine transport system substrate-binding protein
MKKLRPRHALLAAAVAVLVVPAAGVGSKQVLPTKIGPGEGRLTLLAWEGYTEKQWVAPFEKKSGCRVTTKYAGSSDEMVTLMRSAGGGQYDMVSASGDASLRLIYGKDVQPVNVNLVPDFGNLMIPMKSPPYNTIKGVHYGVSLQWGPNTLVYNTTKVKPAPTSWASIYDPKYKGKITVPDNPLQIADAALYLSTTRPGLKITDPYELNGPQFAAVIGLLTKQRPLVRRYWKYASDEINLFKGGRAWLGPAWHYQTDRLVGAKKPVRELVPREGATAWADSWMLSTKAKHPGCAYLWLRWVSTPQVQAQQAVFFGATPANRLACKYMDQLAKGSCARYHADAPLSYYKTISFWKTPIADCGNGRKDCLDFAKWVQAWDRLMR